MFPRSAHLFTALALCFLEVPTPSVAETTKSTHLVRRESQRSFVDADLSTFGDAEVKTANSGLNVSASLAAQYEEIHIGSVCGYHYTLHPATTVEDCGRLCAAKPGCTLFSHGDETGCRLSACGDVSAVGKERQCGFSLDGTPDIQGQCGTMKSPSSSLFMVTTFGQVGVGATCGYHYVTTGSNSPLLCAEDCAKHEGCRIFSYGASLGCRLSACNQTLSFGMIHSCGYSYDGSPAAPDQCGTFRYHDNYLYELPFAPENLPEEQKLHYEELEDGAACGHHYIKDQKAKDALSCARSCAERAGCSLFSFGSLAPGAPTTAAPAEGCRISACGHADALQTEGIACGHSADSITGLKNQCGSLRWDNHKLYLITDFDVIEKETSCEYHILVNPDIWDAKGCAHECASMSGCSVFSFGVRGCRISACNKMGAFDASKPCGYAGGGESRAIAGQCGTRKFPGNYLYQLPSKVENPTIAR